MPGRKATKRPHLRASQRMLLTYGVGLRGLLDARQRTAVQADFGWGRPGSSGLYLGIGHAF